jgi:hypothetical protein
VGIKDKRISYFSLIPFLFTHFFLCSLPPPLQKPQLHLPQSKFRIMVQSLYEQEEEKKTKYKKIDIFLQSYLEFLYSLLLDNKIPKKTMF